MVAMKSVASRSRESHHWFAAARPLMTFQVRSMGLSQGEYVGRKTTRSRRASSEPVPLPLEREYLAVV